MLTSSICDGAATLSGNNSFNKRLKALEQAIASYSNVVASEKVSANNGEFKNVKVSDTATINKETVEQSVIDDLNAKHIDNRDGFAALGQVTVKSLQIEGDEGITSTFKTLNADNARIENAEIKNLDADKAEIDDLTVNNKISELNLAVVKIDDKKALSSTQMILKIAEGFNTANFSTAIRPTWQNKTIALTEDVTTVFSLKGIIDDVSLLPDNPENGDCYFIRSYTDGSLTGPAVASYVNGSWGYVLYPGLEDYVTNTDFATWENDNYVPFVTEVRTILGALVTDPVDLEDNPTDYDIKQLHGIIQSLDEELNDEGGEYYEFKNDVLTFINDTFENYKTEVEDKINKKVSDPTEDGEYIRKVSTTDGVTSAEWEKLENNEKFVNKSYAEDEKTSTITNDGNGIKLESDIGVYTSTADNTNEDESKAVINQEYIRKNLALSKESSVSGKSSYFYEEKGVIPESEHVYLTSAYANGDSNTWYYNKYLPNLYHINTKNYEYSRLTNYADNAANTYTFFFSCDKKGNLSKMTQVEDGTLNTEAQASVHSAWMAFNPEAYDGNCDDYAYYAFPRASGINTTSNPAGTFGYINIYNKGKYVGKVHDYDGNVYGLYNLSSNVTPNYYHVSGKSLRGDAKRILVVNTSSVDTDAIKALIIGVDTNLDEGLDKAREISLPSRITRGTNGIAAGKNYFWFQNGTSNVFSRVDKNGNIASYTLVDPVDNVALSASACRNAWNNYIELENGDCLFYISDCATGRFDYFVYCSDDPAAAAPVEVYRSSLYFSSTAGTDRWPSAANFPFVELGNYVYFFSSFGGGTNDSGCTITAGNSAHWNSVASQYARFDKTSKTWSYTSYPWQINNYACYGPAQKLITEDNYLWVFPNEAYNSSTAGSSCLVIAPSGATTTVDLGTGSAINWFYPGSGDFNSGWTCYLNHSGTANWIYARAPISLAAVNSHGLGCLISMDYKHLMLFKGNGEFKLYNYSNGQKGFYPQGMQVSRSGTALIPMKDGFLLSFSHSTTYRLASNPEGETSGVVYISTNGNNINEEPTYKMFETNEGNGLFHKYYDPYGYNITFEDYNKRFKVMSETHIHQTPVEQAVGLAIWREGSVSSEGTIYLKDGDYTISEVEQ